MKGLPMFKNRSLQVSLVRTPKPEDIITETIEPVDPQEILKIAQEVAATTIVTAGAVYTATQVLKTVLKITEVIVKAKVR